MQAMLARLCLMLYACRMGLAPKQFRCRVTHTSMPCATTQHSHGVCVHKCAPGNFTEVTTPTFLPDSPNLQLQLDLMINQLGKDNTRQMAH